MRKLLAVMTLCAASAMAADVTGYIMDKTCSTKKEMIGNEQCAKTCIGRGDTAVLVTPDGKIYNISNQDKVKASAGKKVTVTGKLDGDSITVASIVPAKS